MDRSTDLRLGDVLATDRSRRDVVKGMGALAVGGLGFLAAAHAAGADNDNDGKGNGDDHNGRRRRKNKGKVDDRNDND